MAFLHGGQNAKVVACHLLENAPGLPQHPSQLIGQLLPEDRAEIDACFSGDTPGLSADEGRVRQEVSKAAQALVGLAVEEAFWILVPESAEAASVWIEAVGLKGEPLSLQCRLATTVLYDPDDEQKHDLISQMRKAACVIHVHNHPRYPGDTAAPTASQADMASFAYWQSLRPELKHKMRAFIVDGNRVVEYTDTKPVYAQWKAWESEQALYVAPVKFSLPATASRQVRNKWEPQKKEKMALLVGNALLWAIWPAGAALVFLGNKGLLPVGRMTSDVWMKLFLLLATGLFVSVFAVFLSMFGRYWLEMNWKYRFFMVAPTIAFLGLLLLIVFMVNCA